MRIAMVPKSKKFLGLMTSVILLSGLIFIQHISIDQVYSKSAYDSGYDHGCDDAGISDEDERYINQPEKGPSYHTKKFMQGYKDGFESCEVSTGMTPNEKDDFNTAPNTDFNTAPNTDFNTIPDTHRTNLNPPTPADFNNDEEEEVDFYCDPDDEEGSCFEGEPKADSSKVYKKYTCKKKAIKDVSKKQSNLKKRCR
jgi:hypothetical protein